MLKTRYMKMEITVAYACNESEMDDVLERVRKRAEGMLELGDFDLMNEAMGDGSECVEYSAKGWSVQAKWEETPTPPAKVASEDDYRVEPDIFRYQRVHSPVGQEIVEMFHGQPTKGTGEET